MDAAEEERKRSADQQEDDSLLDSDRLAQREGESAPKRIRINDDDEEEEEDDEDESVQTNGQNGMLSVDAGETTGNPTANASREGSASQQVHSHVTPAIRLDPAERQAQHLRQEEAAKLYLASQTHPIVLPSYSAWFDLSKIHTIEKKALPEFFNGRNRSKTPSIYKDYRDFMINTYRLNPTEYLTVTACRRNLAGDVCAIMRVHAFLEQWGIINYQIDAETRPSSLGPPFTGHFRILLDTPRGLQPLHPGSKPRAARQTTTDMPATGQQSADFPNIELRRSILQTAPNGKDKLMDDAAAGEVAAGAASNELSIDEKNRQKCAVSGVDISRTRYHNFKTRNFDISANDYKEGRYPSHMSAADFVRIDQSFFKHATDDAWTDQETLLLLEGLEMNEDDWEAVSEHVGTRSREQCIAHFLTLPIEDPYLSATTRQDSLGPLQYAKMPLNQADNPVLSIVAFLANVVDPKVAAAAAQSAIAQMTHSLKDRVAANDDTAATTTAKPDESMQLDEASKPSSTSDKPKNDIERVASIALGAAAAKAHLLAMQDDKDLHHLIRDVVDTQVKKMELKLTQFEQLETLLELERRQLEQSKQALFQERMTVARQAALVKDLASKLQSGQHVAPEELEAATNTMALSGSLPPSARAAPASKPLVPSEHVVDLA
ncbi:uncharacterized protein L969DRAFT_95378 [Mixia osmundae IAM 14324]|uniref:SWIRM domain-containing protein n=1 Tax=Mixia osmundae (strain CBS 9802 / IAM 14324 / JCM 22182 / KY 12970) TaxID=764103 RepID=G7DZ72_MIXOS|nr:uncharacterized protein L969DRAFT_95378 [Mixia osmundae IAM 14324]KEI38284.1 hypothetical protein L969DRAFT_95378 [Mixia osmundae IAM 14324]GAA95882.1 hypothetical protein E5Q_02540 [Mixia osmundae IAM 14324]